MKKYYLSALVALSMTTSSAFAAPEDYIGAVWAIGSNYCPMASLRADGSVLLINNYPELYSILGTKFGGDAKTTFALPNLNGRTIIGAGSETASTSSVNVGQQVGMEQLTLTQNQMPAHTHTATFTTTTSSLNAALKVSAATGTVAPASNTYLSGTAAGNSGMSAVTSKMYTADTTTLVPVKGVDVTGTVGGNVTVASNGGSQPFDNRQPSLGVTYCITTVGLYPTQP